MYPKMYLAFDNCFAIKRWIEPDDWMAMIKGLGVSCVEASTDNEMDPLFEPREYMDDWVARVLDLEKEHGMKVVNFYTGYQTYRTAGFAHPDARIRRKLLEDWHKVLVDIAASIGAGMGFSFFAVPDKDLQDPARYLKTKETILSIMAELVTYAWERGPVPISVEQMYAPHQPPWTIRGSKEYLAELFSLTGKPSYITIDLGHQIGQRRFLRPSSARIGELLRMSRKGERVENVWLGPQSAHRLFLDAAKTSPAKDEGAIARIERELDGYPYLFAADEDGDTYRWLEELGCYSPIVHMQQTNGLASSHAAFTPGNNEKGIIRGDRLLRAIAASYERSESGGMPPKCGEIWLTFEIFAGNADMNHDILERLRETVEYWRRFIPQDGVELDRLF
jgi:D-erythrulose 1-phosphate 3-epimerase